jgi:hypothetical protein
VIALHTRPPRDAAKATSKNAKPVTIQPDGSIPAQAEKPARRQGARPANSGAIAQLGERFNGIEEVVGSIPSGSTSLPFLIEISLLFMRSR